MKQFIVDRHTSTTPKMDEVPNEKIPIYDSSADVTADLANLTVGQIVVAKDTGLAQIITENGQKKIIPLAASTGLPVGFIAPVYKKGNYSGWLYLDGRDTTGTSEELSTHYPLLYAFLGSNKLPDYREFALVGAEKNTTDTIATHDVYTEGQFKDDSFKSHKHTFSGSAGTVSVSGGNHRHSITTRNTTGGNGYCFDVGSGPSYTRYTEYSGNLSMSGTFTPSGSISNTGDDVTRGKRKAVYFYIKATSGLSENAQDNVVAQLNEERSYSTSEVNTGKKWIDGKPIYRRSFTVSGIGTETWTNVTNASWINSVARIIDCEVSTNAVSDYGGHPKARITNGYLQSWDVAGYNAGVMTLEYTKTTDK